VKILFDASTPAPLARFLRGHEVVRADELGWQGLENGALLDAAEQAGFDLRLRRIAVRVATAVDFVQTGQIVTVDVATL
jgi:hypothetical protein